MSSLISRTRGLVSILAAAVLVLAPMQVSASNAVGTDTSLQTFTVNGQTVEDGSSVTLPIGTTSVAVVAEATDPDATVDVVGGTGLVAGDNPLTVTVTNDEVNVQVYSVNLFVQSLSSDTALKSWTVNGVDVVEDEDIFLPYLTESVTVTAETNDVNASYQVQGATDLVSGINILSVVVTAEDGTTQTYNANLVVAFNSDVSLITFQVNGEDVVDGSTVEVDALTSEVDVLVETTDVDATYAISGDTDLQAGENTLAVIVTAADGETVGEYYVTLNVALNTDASVIGIFVNGNEVVDGETIDIEAGTEAVDVDVQTTDADATVEISGNEDLIVGENLLTIVVTAADATTIAEYFVTLNLLRNDDVSLATFQVNNIDVEDGTSLDIDPLTESVDVFVETTDVNATFEISGDSELEVGANELLVTVTAADGVTEFTYTVVLNVLPNVDASAEILVNGELVADGAELTLEWGNFDVEVEVNTNDPEATVEITGDSGLVVGENQLAVVVTAADGETTSTTLITLIVLANTDTSLSTFTINGIDAENDGLVEVEPGTTDLEVVVETTDPEASFEITGDTELQTGDNDLVVSVTAADGVTVFDHVVNVVVPLNDDTSVQLLQVDGQDVVADDTVDLEPYTTEVEVLVETTDEDATYEIVGASGLVAGENVLVVIVTAADGETVQEYSVTLLVALGNDTSLAVFQVNGVDVEDGATVELEARSVDVDLIIETNDPDATFEVVGDDGLFVGTNELVVTVTAANGETRDYVVLLEVPASNDASVVSITVNGDDALAGDVLELDYGTTDVDVVVVTSDEDATYTVAGDAGLITGENTLTVTVTAADGQTTDEFSVTLLVLENGDTSLTVFQVNGIDVADGDVVDLEAGTTDVELIIEANDPAADVDVVGDEGLLTGDNDLVVTVTAANGETAVYVVTLNVAFPDNTGISSIMVDGQDVEVGDTIEVEAGTTEVEVEVETEDPNAVVEVSGASGLVPGGNQVMVIVSTPDGQASSEYLFTVLVLPSSDTSLSLFQVNGEDVEDGATVELAPGSVDVELVIETTDPDATFEVVGDEALFVGTNELVVTVTAVNGETRDYVVLLEVPASNDASVVAIYVDGNEVANEDVLELDYGTNDVAVVVETTDPDATYAVTGDVGLVTGENTLTVTVTAADRETSEEYVVTLLVAANNDTSILSIQLNGEEVADGDEIGLEAGTSEVAIDVETTDSDATVEITGDTDLIPGENTVVIVVTAADGVTFQEYNLTLVVADGSSTELSVFTVNGSDVEDGDVVALEAGTSDVDVVVETLDPNASVTIAGDSGLVTGENILRVVVTSADQVNVFEYIVVLDVLVSNDTSLAVFQVAGNDVADGDVVDLEPGTVEADVEIETTDPEATFEIAGTTGLVTGENILTVTVTAADGETVQVYTVILNLPLNNNTELAKFSINGVDVVDGDTFDVETGQSSVVVLAEPVDANATVVVVGGDNLIIGENTLVLTVTAADGETTQEYTITLFLSSNDTSLQSILVDGLETLPGDIVTVKSDVTSVEVEATPNDENAQVVISGNEELVLGENTVKITVFAQDGTTKDYSFTVRVGGASSDTFLTTLTLNGQDVVNGQTIQLPSRTTSVNIVAVTRDAAATVRILGRTGLVVGENQIQVIVTAGDLKTTRTILLKAVVAPLSSNTNLAEFTVNGTAVVDGGTLELAPLTGSVNVVAKTADIEATTVISGRSNLVTGNNTLTVVVTAANGTTKTYTVTLFVRPISTDTGLASLTVDGKVASPDSVVTVAPGTTSVPVVAVANSTRSSVVVTGATGLRLGDNALSVLITAESGASRLYKLTVRVPASNNVGLKSLTVNGKEYQDGAFIALPRGTKAVSAFAVPSDPQAKVTITGSSNLGNYDNIMVVTIVAADGVTKKDYAVNLWVTPPSADTSLKLLKVNGVVTPYEGGFLIVPALTTSVTVEAVANDPESVVVISGRTELVAGLNTVSITVTAPNGSSKTYTVSVRVLSLSADTSLKSLKVNNVDYVSGNVNLPFGSQSVSVVAVPNDEGAKVSIAGNTALRVGENRVSVKVAAANGTVAERIITVVVAKSSNTDLSALFVNGLSVSGGAVTLPPRTSLAVVKAVPVDPEATVSVSGTALVSGANTVTVVVTAPDASTRSYPITVTVTPLSSNTSLSVLRVAGQDVVSGGTVNVANRTVSVPVVATASDAESVVTFAGNSALRTGSNTVTVTVVAPSGAKQVYTVTVVVAKSSNTDLSALFVNGLSVSGGAVTLPPRTSLAVVKAVPVDPEATVSVSGTALVSGANTVTVVVTAPDASTRSYPITVTVTPLSSNTSLSVLRVAGQDVVSGGTVNVANRTVSVPVVATASDAESVVTFAGNSALRTGSNTVTVTVVAPSGAKQVYTVTVVVAKSSNTDLSALFVNGLSVSGGAVTLPPRTSLAVVKAVPVDPEATVSVSGTALVSGANTVTVVVTAPDASTRSYPITVTVTPLSSNTSLSVLRVAGQDVVSGGTVNVANRTVSVPVVATASDAESVVTFAGNSALRTGSNTVTVTVVAPSGAKQVYTVTVVVAKSSNTDLSALFVNGLSVSGGAVTLPPRTSLAVVKAVPVDPEATVSVSGTALVSGANTVTVVVTAPDASTRSYPITVTVTPLSSDTSLKSFKVNGADYTEGATVNLGFGAKSVSIVAEANDPGAKVEPIGNNALVGGINNLTLRVTAPNGDVRNYAVKVSVPVRSSNANISTAAGTWTINGIDVATVGTIVELPAGATAVTAAAKPEDTKATIAISGTSGLTTGADNTVTFTVTAEDGTVASYTRTVRVKAFSSNTNLTSLTIADTVVVDGGTLTLPAGTTRVSVVPVLESDVARFSVSGNTGLATGDNNVSVLVTAPSGATKTYNVKVVVSAPASDTSLSTFTVNGVTVANGDTVNVLAGTTRVSVSAIPNDPTASVSIVGRSELVAGANTLQVTVTAISGDSTTYTVTVNVGN